MGISGQLKTSGYIFIISGIGLTIYMYSVYLDPWVPMLEVVAGVFLLTLEKIYQLIKQ